MLDKRWLLAGFPCAFMIGTAQAVTMTTLGSAPCGRWVEERAADGWGALGDVRWLVGFLSGLAVESGVDVLPGANSASLELWMDNYCRANPLANTGDGGIILFDELKARMKK